MSSAVGVTDIIRSVDEVADPVQSDCKGCGAPLLADARTCAYCDRQTPHGARRARLDRLSGQSLNCAYGYGPDPMQPVRNFLQRGQA